MRHTLAVTLTGYLLLWTLTAAVGVPSVRRAALGDPQFGTTPTHCLSVEPSAPATPACYVVTFAPAPFIVRVRYGLSGVNIGWGVRQTILWFFGIRVSLATSQMVV